MLEEIYDINARYLDVCSELNKLSMNAFGIDYKKALKKLGFQMFQRNIFDVLQTSSIRLH